nr:response regulator [Gammaproteobacteria bacterium]
DYAETIQSSADTLLTIINDILDFSKVEAGQLELDKREFKLSDSLDFALKTIRSNTAGRPLSFSCDIDPSVPRVVIGDETRLRQILLNLMNNAAKFTEQGSVKVSVKRRLDGIDPLYVSLQFSISDTGIGIPADRIASLFDPFSQVDKTTTRKYGGTGLGLAIVKQLVELQGGEIWVESTMNVGSTFNFTLNFDAYDTRPIDSNLIRIPTHMRVMLIDSTHATQLQLADALQERGIDVSSYSDINQGLQVLDQDRHFNAAIISLDDEHDLNEPSRQFALERKFREHDDYYRLPLVLLAPEQRTTGTPDANPDTTIDLVKPVNPDRVLEALARLWRGRETSTTVDKKSAIKLDETIARQSPLRILLVDDNKTNQKIARLMLSRLGYSADIVDNGEEAVEALTTEGHDIVLMDVQMPVMDGYEATRLIRRRWPDRHLRIIAMTANAMKGDREKCLDAGMDDYMSKPIQIDEFVTVLQRNYQALQSTN